MTYKRSDFFKCVFNGEHEFGKNEEILRLFLYRVLKTKPKFPPNKPKVQSQDCTDHRPSKKT